MKRLLAALTSSLLVWACSGSESSTAGATSETTNGIALRVADDGQQPLPHARVNLYSRVGLAKLDSAVTDESGMAYLQTPSEDCYLEGIAGSDSSLMVWNDFDVDDSVVTLSPSASVVVRADSALAMELQMMLSGTPYSASYQGGAFVFAHVPAGDFSLMLGDSSIAEMSLEAGEAVDTLLVAPKTEPDSIVLDSAGIFTFEDFEDGDSLNNLAKYYPNHGWYFTSIGDSKWVRPGEKEPFSAVLDSSAEQGRFLSATFDVGDSGMVILGSHLGTDSTFFDMSGLTAVRITYRSDCNFSLALEHRQMIAENTFNKALWNVEPSEEWTEVVLKTGDEIVRPSVNQQSWSDVAEEIALFSIFIQEGSFLQVDKIVFEGVNFVYYTP